MTDQTRSYKPGDTANGHVLSNDGQWVPLNSTTGMVPPPPQPKKSHKVRNWTLGIVGAFVLIGIIGSAMGGGEEPAKAEPKASGSSAPADDETKAEKPAEETPAEAEPVEEEPVEEEPAEKPEPTLTVAQENAIQSAENYLDLTAFSKKGLIDQLSSDYGDGYSVKDATFAVNHIKVNWNEQAAKAAENYLELTSFSRQGLIEQLESEYGDQYTHAQAVHGVNQTGL